MASGGRFNTSILSDETFNLLCTMCKHQGKNTEAEQFCVDCHDYYCLTCVKVHSQVPLLLGHKILDKGQFQPESSQGLSMAPTERCDKHSHKHIDMYCQNHDDVGCSTCIAIDHRLCKDIFYIPEFIQNNPKTFSLGDVQLKVETVVKTLTEYSDSLQQEKQSLLERKSGLLDGIRRLRKDINDRLDELEKKSVNEIENKFEALVGKIDEGMKQLQANKTNVTSANVNLASTSSNASDVFVNVKIGEKYAEQATKCMHNSKLRIQVWDIEFTADGKILALLEELNGMGKITEKSTKFVEYKAQQKNGLLQIKGKNTYNIKLQDDSCTCDIVSACALDDGTIVLSDYYNSKLKRLCSTKFTVRDYLELPDSPWQVCPINKEKVAVSVGNEIHFVSLQSRMRCTGKIVTDISCYGLAYENRNLYISNFIHAAVYIYTEYGKRLKHIYKDMLGKIMFSNIRSLAVSKDASKIYVIDSDNGPIVVDKNGKMVGKFNCPQLKGASGCCLNEAGNLLVTGKESKNVLQFGPNGELIGEVLNFSEDGSRPRAVCCNRLMSKLIVGRYNDDRIEVYDI